MKAYLKGMVLGILLALALAGAGSLITISVLSKGVSFETPVVTVATEEHSFKLVGE